jgi:hypothetical protein
MRRVLLAAVVFGCAISLMDGGRLTLRLALPAALWWSFVPLLEMLSLFAASGAARRMPDRRRTVRLFLAGDTAWLLWLLAFAAYWAFLPTETAYGWAPRNRFWFGTAALVALWSGYVDFRFCRGILKLGRWQAARDLLLERLLAWGIGLAIFVWPAGLQMVESWLGV